MSRISYASVCCALAGFLSFNFAVAQDMKNLGIVTGSRSGTYFQMSKDIEKIVAESCHVPFTVYETAGSLENLRRLRNVRFVQLALVQSITLDYIRIFGTEDPEYTDWLKRLRYIYRFHSEEVHIVARKKSGINKLSDLQGHKVSLGPVDSGTGLAALLMLKLANISVREVRTTPIEALDRLFLDASNPNSVDAFFMLTGKPFNLLLGNDPRLQELTLVTVDAEEVFTVFDHAIITKSDYPWLEHGINSAGTSAVLLTFDFQGENCENVAMVARLIADNIDKLRKDGHPKWSEVRFDQVLPNWDVYRCVRWKNNRPVKACRFTDPIRCRDLADERDYRICLLGSR